MSPSLFKVLEWLTFIMIVTNEINDQMMTFCYPFDNDIQIKIKKIFILKLRYDFRLKYWKVTIFVNRIHCFYNWCVLTWSELFKIEEELTYTTNELSLGQDVLLFYNDNRNKKNYKKLKLMWGLLHSKSSASSKEADKIHPDLHI